MKKLSLLILVALAASSVAMAQSSNDVLGAHNGYGRGCVMCHAPHGGAAGNGVTTGDPNNGVIALWGENLNPYYGLGL
jgi:cytochrome c